MTADNPTTSDEPRPVTGGLSAIDLAATAPPEGTSRDEERWFLLDRRQQLLFIDGHLPTTQDLVDHSLLDNDADVDSNRGHLVAVVDQAARWARRVDLETDSVDEMSRRIAALGPPGSSEFVPLRSAFGRLSELDWILAGRASQILIWDEDHRFCGRCGSTTTAHALERSRVCPSCGLAHFPRLAPAVIVLVERADGRALLAWGRQFPSRLFSTLAGFVEAGESLEETVQREVKEEVGIDVANIRYFGSQPWPFPHSLMVGFTADYAGGEIVVQPDEIREADWFSHDDLPPVPRGTMSIAGRMIDDWIARHS